MLAVATLKWCEKNKVSNGHNSVITFSVQASLNKSKTEVSNKETKV
jgi:hypothetical protein